MQTILIDANQLVADFHLASAPWRILLDQATNGHLRIIVPESVIRETVGKYKKELEREVSELRRGFKLLGRLDREVAAAKATAIDVEELAATYEADLRSTLADAGIQTPVPDDGMLLRLTDRAIARRPPFNEQGHGFRDGILWEHAMAEAVTASPTLILVSADKVFASPAGELAIPLEEDVVSKGMGHQRIVLRREVASFVQEHITQDPASHAAAARLLQAEFSQVATNIATALYSMPIEVIGAYGEGTIRATYVMNASITSSGVDPADDELVVLFLVADVRMGVEVEAFDPVGDHRITGLHDIDGHEVSLTATYHRTLGTIDNFTPSDVGVVAVSDGFVF